MEKATLAGIYLARGNQAGCCWLPFVLWRHWIFRRSQVCWVNNCLEQLLAVTDHLALPEIVGRISISRCSSSATCNKLSRERHCRLSRSVLPVRLPPTLPESEVPLCLQETRALALLIASRTSLKCKLRFEVDVELSDYSSRILTREGADRVMPSTVFSSSSEGFASRRSASSGEMP